MVSTFRHLVRAAGLGTLGGVVVWLAVVGAAVATNAPELDVPAVLLLFAQLVIVPLGLLVLLTSGPGGGPTATALLRLALAGWRVGAVAALVAVAVPRGQLSAGIAALYLLPTLAVAAAGAIRLLKGAWRSAASLGEALAAGFLGVGGAFFLLDRQGGGALGSPEHVVLLTAVHFHVAGFGLTLLAAQLAQRHAGLGRVAVALVGGGMLLTPIGFLTHALVQVSGALLVVVGLLVVAGGTVWRLADLPAGGSRRLLFVSATSAWIVAAMAAVYAVSEAAGRPVISLGDMARLHGSFAAIGVVGLGLLGWRWGGRS